MFLGKRRKKKSFNFSSFSKQIDRDALIENCSSQSCKNVRASLKYDSNDFKSKFEKLSSVTEYVVHGDDSKK